MLASTPQKALFPNGLHQASKPGKGVTLQRGQRPSVIFALFVYFQYDHLILTIPP